MLLIVTHRMDPHADVVAKYLRERGHSPVFLYHEEMLTSVSTSIRQVGHTYSAILRTPDATIDLGDVTAVWMRRQNIFRAPTTPVPDEQRVRAEARYVWRGIWRILRKNPDIFWMSDPQHIANADNKIEQLALAQELGFRIPRTIVTNEPDVVRRFRKECADGIIYKAMTDADVSSADNSLLYTTAVSDQEDLQGVSVNPCLFQENIRKRIEIRSTFIGSEEFTAGLHSQEDDRTKTDWRRLNNTGRSVFPFTVEHLPAHVRERCLRMLAHYGLNYGAFDFIVTPDDEYVFLELNPNGQWLFVQFQLPQLKMAQSMANVLARVS